MYLIGSVLLVIAYGRLGFVVSIGADIQFGCIVWSNVVYYLVVWE